MQKEVQRPLLRLCNCNISALIDKAQPSPFARYPILLQQLYSSDPKLRREAHFHLDINSFLAVMICRRVAITFSHFLASESFVLCLSMLRASKQISSGGPEEAKGKALTKNKLYHCPFSTCAVDMLIEFVIESCSCISQSIHFIFRIMHFRCLCRLAASSMTSNYCSFLSCCLSISLHCLLQFFD